MFKMILIFFIFITISCSQNDDVSNNLNENLYNYNISRKYFEILEVVEKNKGSTEVQASYIISQLGEEH